MYLSLVLYKRRGMGFYCRIQCNIWNSAFCINIHPLTPAIHTRELRQPRSPINNDWHVTSGNAICSPGTDEGGSCLQPDLCPVSSCQPWWRQLTSGVSGHPAYSKAPAELAAIGNKDVMTYEISHYNQPPTRSPTATIEFHETNELARNPPEICPGLNNDVLSAR